MKDNNIVYLKLSNKYYIMECGSAKIDFMELKTRSSIFSRGNKCEKGILVLFPQVNSH